MAENFVFLRKYPNLRLCLEWLKNSGRAFFGWLFSTGEIERTKKDAVEKFQMSVRVTAKCRYLAATRLQRQGKFTFFATTILSLGLIFIPLMQNSGVRLAFETNILNMMSIFLAVSVLVYSVVIGTARYELRAENLTECGDKLKDLNRFLSKELLDANVNTAQLLEKLQERYTDIVTDTENHTRRDYTLAMLEMRRDYDITGFPRLWRIVSSQLVSLAPYVLPATLLLAEVVFIADMLSITSVSTKFLVPSAP